MNSLRLSAPVYVCLSLCSLAYLRNHIPKLPNFVSILSLWPWLGPSCSGDAIRCVLPVVWTTQILRDSTGNNTGRGGVWVYRSGVLWWPYLSVCLCVCVCLCGTTRPIFTNFCVHVTYGCGSVLLWRCCDTLCTSGFMDDVLFAQRGRPADGSTAHMQPWTWL